MTQYGICYLSLVPVREQPSDKSEMINQLLFGELVYILEAVESWYLIKSSHDQYEGWVDNKQVRVIEKELFTNILDSKPHFVNTIYSRIDMDEYSLNLVMGSRLPQYSAGKFRVNDIEYTINDGAVSSTLTEDSAVISTAMKYMGTPYLWGGRSPFGIDCSGFVQVVFGMHGIQLKRDAYLQAETGETISFIDEVVAGDLVFFDNAEGKITHVGIIVGKGKIIHASGRVRIDSIDHQGIYNQELKKYTHKLRIIKRILD